MPHTHVPTWTWTWTVYVFVIDAYARRIIGWCPARSMTTPLVLEHAFFTRAREGVTDLADLVSHSDARSQCTSIACTTRLVEEGADPPVGSFGDAYDALAETTVESFKNELIQRQGPWRDVERHRYRSCRDRDLELGRLANNERPHETLEDLTPAATEHFNTITKRPLATAG